MNKLKKVIDQTGFEEVFLYDSSKRLAFSKDRNENEVEYTYDIRGLLKKRRELNSNQEEKYSYDDIGNLVLARNQNVEYTYEYFKDQRLKTKKLNGKIILSYDYDEQENLRQIELSDNQKTEYEYDILGRLSKVIEDNQVIAKYDYNVDDTVKEISYKNNMKSSYVYDEDKNIIGIKTLDEAGKILQDYSYEYDILGNQRIAVEDGKKTSYFYDSMNRLKEVLGENQKESYIYDPVGNRIQRESNNKISRYFYDKKNRLKRIQDGKDLTYFHYDNQGNLLSEKTKDSLTRHFYDGFNRNTKTVKGQNIQQNYYDPEGMRYKISENGLERNFVFSGSSIVAELDEKLNLQTAYTRGLGLISRRDYTDKNLIDKTLKKEEAFRSYYLENAHGDIKGIVGENGKILNKYRYDSFGKIEEAEEKIRNIFKYAGEQHDPLTNQYYLRARYYNPVIGRFTQEDRYRGDGLNLYAYCDNNPINYIDPTGYAKTQCQLKEELYQRQKLRKEGKLKESNYKNGNKPEKGTRGTDKSTWKEQDRKRRLENKGYYQDANDRWRRPNGQYASNREVGISKPKPQKTVEGGSNRVSSGGRLGNAATRAQNEQIATYLEKEGWEITGGGERLKEEYLPGFGGGSKGSNYVDITATKNGQTIRINTVDVYKNGQMTTREANAASLIDMKTGGNIITIPKGAGLGELADLIK